MSTIEQRVRLDGRVVVITGAAGGIGSAVTAAAVGLGASVVATDLPSAGLDALGETHGDSVMVAGLDVRSSAEWSAVRDSALERFGRIDGLVNNAGIEGAIVPLLEYPEEMFDMVLDVNVKGVWLGMKTLVPAMGERGGGSIVNVSSVAGVRSAPNLGAYSASKHAVVGLTRTASLEFAPLGVRVNAICPAPIKTRMMEALEDANKTDEMSREDIAGLIAMAVPMGRYGQPTEVADLMTFLLSDAASFLSGVTLPIDGAMTA